MRYTIQNEFLTVQVDDKGAELASIRDRSGTEYLWQGNPEVWGRRAPLLFPFIARLKDEQYSFEGHSYHIGIHGFCRDAQFAVEDYSATGITLRLEDSEDTRAQYPFAFSLSVRYFLEGTSLRKTHRIENRSSGTMYYELGGHDGYRAPLSEGEQMADYSLRFPGLAEIRPYGMDAENMITPKAAVFPLPGGLMPLKPSHYRLDTVILDELPERKAELVDGKGRVRLSVAFDEFAYLGIWTAGKPFDTNYVCIEPWTSLPDATFVGRDLRDKAGVRSLEPGAGETLGYTLTVYPLV